MEVWFEKMGVEEAGVGEFRGGGMSEQADRHGRGLQGKRNE